MKIQAKNAFQFLRHCKALQELAGIPVAVVPVDGIAIYTKLRRLELKAHRLTTLACNEPDIDTDTSKIEKSVLKLFPNGLKGFFVNGDPRGYALKLKNRDEQNKLPEGLSQDWGSYGLLAPEF